MNLPDDWWLEERPLPVVLITLADILFAIRGREERESQIGLHSKDDRITAKVFRVALNRRKSCDRDG